MLSINKSLLAKIQNKIEKYIKNILLLIINSNIIIKFLLLVKNEDFLSSSKIDYKLWLCI